MSELPAQCAPFEADLSALLDEQLDARRAGELRAHLATCAACARRLDALRGVDLVLRRLAAEPIDAAQRARLRPVLTPAQPAHRAAPQRTPSRRPRWIAPAALIATAAAAATFVLVLRPAPLDAPQEIPSVVVAQPPAPKTRADAEVAAREINEKLEGPLGASAPPSAPVARSEALADDAGGIASPDLLEDASDEDLALATALSELPALESPRDLELVEQLDLLETLGSLDDAGAAGRG